MPKGVKKIEQTEATSEEKETIAKETEKLYHDKDESCTAECPKRIHEILVSGEVKPVVFEHGKDVKLPLAIAAKFNIPGFKVYDNEEEIKKPTEAPQNIAVALDADKVVASYEELTTVALYLRAAIVSGGERFNKDSKRADIIDFLIESRKAAEPNKEQPVGKAFPILDDEAIDDDKLKEMLRDLEG